MLAGCGRCRRALLETDLPVAVSRVGNNMSEDNRNLNYYLIRSDTLSQCSLRSNEDDQCVLRLSC